MEKLEELEKKARNFGIVLFVSPATAEVGTPYPVPVATHCVARGPSLFGVMTVRFAAAISAFINLLKIISFLVSSSSYFSVKHLLK